MGTALAAISRAELTLLTRNLAMIAAGVLMPLAVAATFVFTGRTSPHVVGWGFEVSMMLMLLFGMSAYMTSAASLSYRRDELYLKRLRSGPVSDTTVLLGVLSPVIVLTLAQCLLMLVVVAVAGPAVPANPLLVLLVLLAGTAVGVTAGMATTGVTHSAEQAQTVGLPFLILLVGSGVWAGMDIAHGLSPVQLLLPGGAVLEVLRQAYGGGESTFTGQLAASAPGLGVLVAWVALGGLAARRWFRWEPRR
ncbi:ABC-2 type transport system permease protein [Amycolatopsis arida]|uniref:ABC-2 type transport system permease protein n=1 Tax=Amycolatopsis arida TaxID=587909 RepID=A0A1I5YFC3_9PSEU|nr:ABC transporter permease [Amycolatopsis arida]TDX90476.1 ABC-2 type transport system permease protein [Amycolatopsis arida]SFQ42935.1 ABC-2 type transport system permease protein [Amycolatopsis arida]